MVAAFPFGIIGLIVLTGVGVLFIKVLKDRLNNKEDDYYSKNVDK
jgi:Tfp pilus assembly protein PilW